MCVHLQLQARTLGCMPPKALSDSWPLHWDGCNFIPEDLHPKSFRGYFGHNTNVWAAASRKGLNVSFWGLFGATASDTQHLGPHKGTYWMCRWGRLWECSGWTRTPLIGTGGIRGLGSAGESANTLIPSYRCATSCLGLQVTCLARPLTGMLRQKVVLRLDQVQVRHRCPCLDLAVCGEEAQMVEEFAQQGLLVPNIV